MMMRRGRHCAAVLAIAYVGAALACRQHDAGPGIDAAQTPPSTTKEDDDRKREEFAAAYQRRLQALAAETVKLHPEYTVLRTFEMAVHYRDLLDIAEDVAKQSGEAGIPVVQEALKQEEPRDIGMIRKRLSLLALAKLANHKRAADLLFEVIDADGLLAGQAILAVSYMERDLALPLLRRLLTGRQRFFYNPNVVRLLAILGDEGDLKLLQRGLAEGRADQELDQPAIESMARRLRMQPEAKRSQWARDGLLYWQALGERPNYHSIQRNYIIAAQKLEEHRIRFSLEFLRSKLPAIFAIMIIVQQKELGAIPDLEAIVRSRGNSAGTAEWAFQQLRKGSNQPKRKPAPGGRSDGNVDGMPVPAQSAAPRT